MPLTTYHIGTGIFIKAIMKSSFSFMVFAWTQIIIDIQPLIVLLAEKGHLHGFSHTYIGATLLAVIAAISSKYLIEIGLNFFLSPKKQYEILWRVAFLSAFMGAYSHIILDSVMHSDIVPLFPFSQNNFLYRIISVGALHNFCTISGLLGLILLALMHFYRKKSSKNFIAKN
jgi:hypothetical protein